MFSAVHMRPRPIGCLMLALRVALVLLPHRRGSGIAASASLAGVIMIFIVSGLAWESRDDYQSSLKRSVINGEFCNT